jgi:hypothetical protein
VQVNQQIRLGLHQLFPRYFAMREGNMTWRFTPSENEVMHYDSYGSEKGKHIKDMRIKFFVNLDAQPRIWRVSHHLSHMLANCFDPRLAEIGTTTTLNDITRIIGTTDVLFEEPAHRIEWPALAAVFANGDIISHELVYGHRAVGGDFSVKSEDMLHPELQAERQLPSWLAARERAAAARV